MIDSSDIDIPYLLSLVPPPPSDRVHYLGCSYFIDFYESPERGKGEHRIEYCNFEELETFMEECKRNNWYFEFGWYP